MTLDEVKPGMSVYVEKVNGAGLLRKRLLEMGIVPGVKIQMKKKAPLGDPLEIELHHYLLTIRKSEAKKIEVKQ